MTIDRTVRGIRDRIPQGYVLGRKDKGDGPVQLLSFAEIGGGGGGNSDVSLAKFLIICTHATRPNPPTIPPGMLAIAYETDTLNTFVWTGAAWTQINGGGSSSDGEPEPAHPGWDVASACALNGATFVPLPLTANNTILTTPASSVTCPIWCAPGRIVGKRYFEMSLVNTGNNGRVGLLWGIGRSNLDGGILGDAVGQFGWNSSGVVYSRVSFSPFGSNYTVATIQGWVSGNTLCVAVDLDARLIWFRTNGGNWNNSGTANPATGAGGLDMNRMLQRISAPIKLYPAGTANSTNGDTSTVNLGTSAFAQAVPAGFIEWKG
jgi:hypothetical protein